jgi:hypothetical protein
MSSACTPRASYIVRPAGQSTKGVNVPKDVIAEAKAKIEKRLRELIEEHQEVHRALLGLETATNKQSPAQPLPTPRKRRRKRARPGQRRQQFIDAVREQSGITVAQIAKKIGSAPNPLYALARQLLKDGEVEKDGAGYRIAKETVAKKPRAKKAIRAKAKKTTRAKKGRKKRGGKSKS